MYKLVVFTALLAVAAAAPGLIGAPGYYGSAGLIGAPGIIGSPLAAPLASPWGHGLVGAGYVGAPVVKTALPVATSYANTVRIASPAVAPIVTAAHAPVIASPLAHAW